MVIARRVNLDPWTVRPSVGDVTGIIRPSSVVTSTTILPAPRGVRTSASNSRCSGATVTGSTDRPHRSRSCSRAAAGTSAIDLTGAPSTSRADRSASGDALRRRWVASMKPA